MKTSIKSRTLAKSALLGTFLMQSVVLMTPNAQAAPLIDLANPVSTQTGTVSDLALYYAFDQSTGSSVTDSSGDSITGTIEQNNATTSPSWATGVNAPGTTGYNNALYFSNPTFSTTTKQGAVATGNLTSHAALNLENTDFTIGLWIKMDSIQAGVTQTAWLLDKKGGSTTSTNGWAVTLTKDATERWSMQLKINGGFAVSNVFGDINNLGWHHLGVSFDSATGSATFYVDGQAISTLSSSLPISGGAVDNAIGLLVGQRNGTGAGIGTPFDMKLDDLFVASSIYEFQPVPEPSSALLLLMPGAALALRRFRRPSRRP